MRPLSELDVAGVVGVFCDIDGTLTDGGKLTALAYDALCSAHDAGLRVVPVTGRAGGWAEVLASLWPVDAVIAENGALLVTGDGVRRFWDPPEVRAEQKARLDSLIADIEGRLPWARRADDAHIRLVDVAYDVGEKERVSDEQSDALTTIMKEHGASVLVSSIHSHAYYGDHDKAKMLVRLCREEWSETEESVRRDYVFVGDSANDQSGFSFFERSVGVANVRHFLPQLDPPPRYVTPSEGGRGFSELVRAILAARRDA